MRLLTFPAPVLKDETPPADPLDMPLGDEGEEGSTKNKMVKSAKHASTQKLAGVPEDLSFFLLIVAIFLFPIL